jgi:hypothetical protein
MGLGRGRVDCEDFDAGSLSPQPSRIVLIRSWFFWRWVAYTDSYVPWIEKATNERLRASCKDGDGSWLARGFRVMSPRSRPYWTWSQAELDAELFVEEVNS